MKGTYPMSNPLKNLAAEISDKLLKDKARPASDPIDRDKFSFAVLAGDNKFGFKHCPTCGKLGTNIIGNAFPPGTKVFQFRTRLDAQEYKISGMCQACQDSVFKED